MRLSTYQRLSILLFGILPDSGGSLDEILAIDTLRNELSIKDDEELSFTQTEDGSIRWDGDAPISIDLEDGRPTNREILQKGLQIFVGRAEEIPAHPEFVELVRALWPNYEPEGVEDCGCEEDVEEAEDSAATEIE